MKSLKKTQFEHEYNAWTRKLEFFAQENALLKYRLSEMVDNNEGNNFLLMAEYFQNELLLKDEMLEKLIKELQEFSGLLGRFRSEQKLSEKITTYHNKLRKGILQFEKKFLNLSNDFNEKMLENTAH